MSVGNVHGSTEALDAASSSQPPIRRYNLRSLGNIHYSEHGMVEPLSSFLEFGAILPPSCGACSTGQLQDLILVSADSPKGTAAVFHQPVEIV